MFYHSTVLIIPLAHRRRLGVESESVQQRVIISNLVKHVKEGDDGRIHCYCVGHGS